MQCPPLVCISLSLSHSHLSLPPYVGITVTNSCTGVSLSLSLSLAFQPFGCCISKNLQQPEMKQMKVEVGGCVWGGVGARGSERRLF